MLQVPVAAAAAAPGCSDSSEFMQQGAGGRQQAAMRCDARHLATLTWRCQDVISFCGRHII